MWPYLAAQVARSNDSHVMLENVNLDTEGRYGCEITAEYPFPTVEKKGNITVVGEQPFLFQHLYIYSALPMPLI